MRTSYSRIESISCLVSSFSWDLSSLLLSMVALVELPVAAKADPVVDDNENSAEGDASSDRLTFVLLEEEF